MDQATANKILRALEGIERTLRDELTLQRRLEARPMFVFVPTQWTPEETGRVAQMVATYVGWAPLLPVEESPDV